MASTSFWQQSVDDRFRGRVHALDFLGMTLSFSTFALLAGWFFDRSGSIETTVLAACGALAATAATWSVLTRPLHRLSSQAAATPHD